MLLLLNRIKFFFTKLQCCEAQIRTYCKNIFKIILGAFQLLNILIENIFVVLTVFIDRILYKALLSSRCYRVC